MRRFSYLLLMFCITTFIHAQQKTISGVVTDGQSPLPGVSILNKTTSVEVVTDFDGKYTIKATEGDALEFHYIGMISKSVVVGQSKIIDVILEVDSETLEEIVVSEMVIEREREAMSKAIQYKFNSAVLMSRPPSNSQYFNAIESYDKITENTFKASRLEPLSTFSIDVDKAAYSNIRRMINNGQKIEKDAVKIEEMINYFKYDYEQPNSEHPFSIQTEYSSCAWNTKHKLIKIGLQGKEVPMEAIPPSNLVFLLDVSGSMNRPNKLPLLKSAFKLLVNQLRDQDKVSIVVYAGAAGQVLEPTSGDDKQKILDAFNILKAGGSTAGGAGIKLAYKIAKENFIEGGNNRVIMATDGDFNVGFSSDKAMEDLIVEKRESGVYLTVLGFGMGNYKDSKLETLADKGNGNHAYVDTMQEARKVLGEEFGGTLYTIAKDVKIQVEFNPTKIAAYRLIGYENRMLNSEDFKDDKKDAGELGSGHSVTALYEIIPIGVKSKFLKDVDELKYTENKTDNSHNEELLTVKFRYKNPDSTKSKEIVYSLEANEIDFAKTSTDFKFVSAVSLFGMNLRTSEFANQADLNDVIALAEQGRGKDKDGYRAEFIRLVKSYK